MIGAQLTSRHPLLRLPNGLHAAVCCLALALSLLSLPARAAGAESPVISFSKDIAPILQTKCLACHGPEKSKGGLQLHTYANLRRGGDSKEASLSPGHPEQSKLYQLLITNAPEDRMPQKDDPLPAAQIKLFAGWIRAGALFDGSDSNATLASLLPRSPHPPPPAIYARPVPIPALAFSPDGRTLAASGYHEVTLWDPANGTLLGRLTNVDRQTLALAYSPDGSLLAVGGGTPGRSGEAQLFSISDGRLKQTLLNIGDLVLAVAFSANGQRLAVGGADNVIHLFQVSTGQEERRIEQHADWVMALDFSPDGSHLASASRDKSVRLLDTRTGDLEETYTGHSQPVFAVAFEPDGRSLVSGGRDQSLHVWQAKEAKRSYEIPGMEADIWRLLVHSNQLFTCSADHQVRIYQLGTKSAELRRTLNGHQDVVYGLAYHASSQRLASSAYDGEIRIWNAADGSLLTAFRAAPGYHAAAPAVEKAARRAEF